MKTEIEDRKKFLECYAEFDKWLKSIGFRTGHYWNESATPLDYKWSHYDDHIDDLYGVEHYLNDTIKLSIRFIRDRNEHRIMFTGELGSYSELKTIEQAKDIIISKVREIRDAKLSELAKLNSI